MNPSPEQLSEALELLAQLQTGPAQKWLSDERYFKYFDSATEWAKECIEDSGSVPHSWWLHGRRREGDDEDWIMQPIAFQDWPPPDGKKYQAMQGIGAMFADKHPDHMLMCIVHVSESWMAEYAPEDAPKDGSVYLPKGIPTPSERPDRVECLTVTATSMDQRISTLNLPMLRDKDGKFEKWGKPVASRRYKPGQTSSPRDNADILAINLLMGYFMASKAARE